ncbi:insulin-like growth factor 1 receptor [Acanthaster planci]|uniref:receptor protein-tyrosine kinase n=1 Tax=Acanthaster planci TaxID=133434 RepID=A0A8B7YUX2_ACAPL|nr:insulin-like growth factor 1 receptor [Acanthaster planci]
MNDVIFFLVSTVSSFIPTVNLQESDVTSDSIRFTWDEVPCEELNSPLSYYNYKTELRNQATGELVSSDLRYQVKRATQLTPCTTYSFKVAVRNTIGIGSYSNATEVTTSTVAPSQVQALSVDSVEDQPTALRVRWNQPSGNCPIDNYTIHYDLVWLSQCEIPESNRTLVGTTEGTEYSITGLFPHSRYKVDVTAKTSAGEGDRSYVYADTADAAPSEPPRGITNTATLERGLRFEWQPPSCQGRRGIITGYGYRLLDLEERGVNITENTPSNETQADVSGLVPYTLYSFQVLARTSAGDGPYSEAIRLRTAQAKPPQVPMVTTPSGNATSITVRWRRPDPPHGIIIAYYIRYGIVLQGNEEVKVTEALNDTVLEFVLTGLVADSNYSMQVQAETIVSRGSWSEPSFCTTLETVPSAPVGVHLDNKGDNCLVTWNPPEQGDVISYKIFRNAYLIPRDGSDDLDPIPDLNASDFVVTDDTTPRTYSVKKSDLATYTRYRFQISASTQAGEGSVSKETNSICDSPRAAPVELQQPMISDTPGNPVFDRTFKVTIGSISQRNGPVSCVEITIIWLKTDENVEGTDPDILYHPDLYRSYEDAKVTQGLPYVAVVLEGNDLIESKEVTIGSGGKSECQSTGSRRKRRQAPMIHEGENGALTPDSKYTAFIRAYVVLDNGMEDYVTSPLLQPVWTAQATDFTAIIAGMCVLSVVLLVVLIAFGVILRRRRAKSFQPSPTVVTTNVEMDEIDYERPIKPDDRQSTVYEDVGLPTWALRWEILWKNLVVDDKVLGQGNFGEVRLGTVNVSGKKTETAIKVLKGRASETDREDFMEEFRTMTNIGYHPNVVSLLGACQHKDVLYVALEYLPKGDLRSYLRTGRLQSESDEGALSPDQLIKFALDVAKGMEHLAMSGVIHRDLAARNILLGETLVAKVSDFGLSRGEDIYVQMSKRRVPTRWLAIESLSSRTYTTQSDVWSFGILLWEIASIGGTPYATIATKSLLARLMQGYRMPKPINCDKEIFSLMLRCWEEDPSNRPSFSDLVRIFSDLSDKKVQHTYMAVDRAHYANFSVIRPERDDN